jgi:hypothetical protein
MEAAPIADREMGQYLFESQNTTSTSFLASRLGKRVGFTKVGFHRHPDPGNRGVNFANLL